MQDSVTQSAADRDGVSLADYIHAMFFFLRRNKARHVLMIGCGGGTLATMLSRMGVRVTMVDIAPVSFEIARRYFHLPDEVECHVADGLAFLRGSSARYDAIVLDAYSQDVIPAQFLKTAFFDLARSRLNPRRALFLVNVLIARDDDPARGVLVRLMRKTWRQVRLLDAGCWENRNAVAVAGAVRDLKRPKLLMRPARGAAKLARDLKTFQWA